MEEQRKKDAKMGATILREERKNRKHASCTPDKKKRELGFVDSWLMAMRGVGRWMRQLANENKGKKTPTLNPWEWRLLSPPRRYLDQKDVLHVL